MKTKSLKTAQTHQDKTDFVMPVFFQESVWDNPVESARSSWLTPLFIERYKGIRTALRANSHDFWEITFVVDGRGFFHTSAESHLTQGAAVLVPPGVMHREHSTQIMDTVWLGLTGEFFKKIKTDSVLLVHDTDLCEEAAALWRYSISSEKPNGLELDGMALSITGKMLRTRENGNPGGKPRMDRIVNFIHENLSGSISVSDLAKAAGCSEGYFYREFQKHFGMPPVKFMNAMRVRNAMHWLKNSSLKIEEISILCGFNDQFYFSRIFKKTAGASPSAYRAGKTHGTVLKNGL